MTFATPSRSSRLLAGVTIFLATVIGGATAEAADNGGAKQEVFAVNEVDGSKHALSGTQVTSTGSNTAAPENLAIAKASCTNCRTVAVAVQAVLITRPSDTITPKNAAVAVNSDCSGCYSGAFAYQCVVTTNGPVTIGSQGQQHIAQLRGEIDTAARSDLAFPELEVRLDALVEELWDVIDEALAAAGESTRCDGDERQSVE